MIDAPNSELLQAIGTMLDQKLDQKLEPIYTRLDGIDSRLDGFSSRLDRLESGQTVITQRLDRVETLLEHDIPKQIKQLAEGHEILLSRLPQEYELETMRNRASTLEVIVERHTKEIAQLKQA